MKGDFIELDNYKVYQYDRPAHPNARKGSGGVAIALHNSIFYTHSVVSINKGIDGQLSIKIKNNLNDFIVGILALYLSPDSYNYGRDPEGFFNNASALYQDLADCDL